MSSVGDKRLYTSNGPETKKLIPEQTNLERPLKMSRKFLTPGNIIGLVVLMSFLGFCTMNLLGPWNKARKEQAAIRPGMDLVEVFKVARNWTWAWGYPDEDEAEVFRMTANPETSVGFGEQYYDDWDSFIAAVIEHEEEWLPYQKWSFTYTGGPTPLKYSFSIFIEDSKVVRVSEVRSWD